MEHLCLFGKITYGLFDTRRHISFAIIEKPIDVPAVEDTAIPSETHECPVDEPVDIRSTSDHRDSYGRPLGFIGSDGLTECAQSHSDNRQKDYENDSGNEPEPKRPAFTDNGDVAIGDACPQSQPRHCSLPTLARRSRAVWLSAPPAYRHPSPSCTRRTAAGGCRRGGYRPASGGRCGRS